MLRRQTAINTELHTEQIVFDFHIQTTAVAHEGATTSFRFGVRERGHFDTPWQCIHTTHTLDWQLAMNVRTVLKRRRIHFEATATS